MFSFKLESVRHSWTSPPGAPKSFSISLKRPRGSQVAGQSSVPNLGRSSDHSQPSFGIRYYRTSSQWGDLDDSRRTSSSPDPVDQEAEGDGTCESDSDVSELSELDVLIRHSFPSPHQSTPTSSVASVPSESHAPGSPGGVGSDIAAKTSLPLARASQDTRDDAGARPKKRARHSENPEPSASLPGRPAAGHISDAPSGSSTGSSRYAQEREYKRQRWALRMQPSSSQSQQHSQSSWLAQQPSQSSSQQSLPVHQVQPAPTEPDQQADAASQSDFGDFDVAQMEIDAGSPRAERSDHGPSLSTDALSPGEVAESKVSVVKEQVHVRGFEQIQEWDAECHAVPTPAAPLSRHSSQPDSLASYDLCEDRSSPRDEGHGTPALTDDDSCSDANDDLCYFDEVVPGTLSPIDTEPDTDLRIIFEQPVNHCRHGWQSETCDGSENASENGARLVHNAIRFFDPDVSFNLASHQGNESQDDQHEEHGVIAERRLARMLRKEDAMLEEIVDMSSPVGGSVYSGVDRTIRDVVVNWILNVRLLPVERRAS